MRRFEKGERERDGREGEGGTGGRFCSSILARPTVSE